MAVGDPHVRERGARHYAGTSTLIALGVAGVVGLIHVAPEGAAFITIMGYEIPMEVAEAFVAAGGVISAVNDLVFQYFC